MEILQIVWWFIFSITRDPVTILWKSWRAWKLDERKVTSTKRDETWVNAIFDGVILAQNDSTKRPEAVGAFLAFQKSKLTATKSNIYIFLTFQQAPTWMKFVVKQIVHMMIAGREIKYFDIDFFWKEIKRRKKHNIDKLHFFIARNY